MKKKLHILWLPSLLLATSLMLFACNVNSFLPRGATSTPPSSPMPTAPLHTPTPTPTPTPIPSPTPVPAVRVASGDHALFNGDWEAALSEYSEAARSTGGDPEIQAAAWLGMGRVYYYTGSYAQALSSFRVVVDQYPDSPHRAAAFFFLGQTYDILTRFGEAAEAYLNYMALKPGVIDAYVLEMRADSLFAAGNYPAALADYQAALQSPHLSDRIALQIKMARSYALTGDYATAIVMYQDIYTRASSDYTKAQVNYLLGQAYTAIGQIDQANLAYLASVENYPIAYDSYQALVILVNAGYPVDELDRGLVDYFAGQYNVAIAAFDRYLAGNPTDPDTAYYYKGLSLRALGNYYGAIEQWDVVIDNYSGSRHWANAWEQKAYVFWGYLGDKPAGIQVLLDFVAVASWHPRAAEFLNEAARDSEVTGNLEQAARLWERVANEYPHSDYAFRALFLAGITYYRVNDFASAQDAFQRSLGLANNTGSRAAANFWIGKAQQAQGDSAGARQTWEQTAAIDPTGYYSERARDLLANRAPFTPPQTIDLGYDRRAEKVEAEIWMRNNLFITSDVDLSSPGPLLSEARLIRGTELWHLGLYRQARDEFESLRVSLEADAANTYRLANYLSELGVYRSSLLAARRVLTLAGMDDAATLNAPMHFNRIRFGTYYSDLVFPAAQSYDFHPFFLLSVMRQESFFESFAGSSAGARGLMQFMPATGQERAERLRWPPNYSSEDLDRPLVSITFGANYLDFNRDYLDGDLYAALAAYNGGPGNAREWKDLSAGDQDLFLEIVRFEETRRYIRSVYEIFSIYCRLYSLAH